MKPSEISDHAYPCHVLDELGRYEEAVACYTARGQRVVVVNEYQPSRIETIQVRRVAAPQPVIGILIIFGLIYLFTRK